MTTSHYSSSLENNSNLVFIDSNVDDYQTLVSGIDNADVFLLDSTRDGIEQITEKLSNYSQLDSIQIISHGDISSLQLGNSFLNQDSFDLYTNELQQWGDSLTTEGDLLFYGCNLAANGDQFIQQISQATGADVAASNDLTGKGGDWQLEVSVGLINTNLSLTATAQAQYQGTLVTVDTSATNYRYDFGSDFSPLASGWQRITPSTTGDISWNGSVTARDRGTTSGIDATLQDFVFSNQTRTLSHKIDNGVWNVTVAMGDRIYGHDNMRFSAEGIVLNGDIDNVAGQFSDATGTVTVTDGVLDLTFEDLGGRDPNWVLNRLELNKVNDLPSNETTNLVVKGSFEEVSTATGSLPGEVNSLPGWQLRNGAIAVRNSGDEGVPSSSGSKHLDIDYRSGRPDGVFQNIQTEAGVLYELTFDIFTPRVTNGDDQSIVVEWNGTKPAISGFQAGRSGEWTEVKTTVVGTGGTDRLLFRESGTPGASNGEGSLIDNVVLRRPSLENPNSSDSPNGLGFVRETIATGLNAPTAFSYTDDGRTFVAEKSGKVQIVENGVVTSTFIDLNQEVLNAADLGLIGMELDPDFTDNGWVYLQYTVDLDPANPDKAPGEGGVAAGGQLIRVKANSNNPNVADLSTRETILDGHRMLSPTHSVGDIAFDNDGNLLFSWGDGGFVDELRFAAQDPDSVQGKIFRINPDTKQGISENPYYDPTNPNSVRSKVWATGVRNPFRLSFDSVTGDTFFGDVTDRGPEEINRIRANEQNPDNLNFGWPYFVDTNRTEYGEVPNNFVYQDAFVTLPLTPGENAGAVVGGFVYRGDAYPDSYNGRYFYGNVFKNELFTTDLAGNPLSFGNNSLVTTPVDIELGPDGTVHILSIGQGEIYRLAYDPDNVTAILPTARASASVTAGTDPLTVDFFGDKSSAPNGGSLQYAWDFDTDGFIDSTEANPSFTYTNVGRQIATLTVSDQLGSRDTKTVEVTVVNSISDPNNVAFGRPTRQSSTEQGALSSRAVDGNTNDSVANASVASTISEDKAFWEVDLGAVYDLSSVQVFVGDQPLNNSLTFVSEQPFETINFTPLLADPDVWNTSNPATINDQATIAINQRGRYLRLQVQDVGVVSLAEVKVFSTPTPTPPSGTVDFNQTPLTSYAGTQDQISTVDISANGSEFKIQGNTWKKIELPYQVTENTILEFDFKSDVEGETHGIGFDTDNSISVNRVFKLSGTQVNDGTLTNFNDYVTGSGWKTYRIRVGDFFTGNFSFLTFINDHDVNNPTGSSTFRNIRLSES